MADLSTVGSRLYWSYAGLAMAHAALSDGAGAYQRKHYIIRNRTFHGLRNGTIQPRCLAEEARLALVLPSACCYCGSPGPLTADHLLPTSRGGAHAADNLVWACRRCNSSKRDHDLLSWLAARGQFPPLLLIRRYLKLAIVIARERGIIDDAVADTPALPFSLAEIPLTYPAPALLTLWVVPLPTTSV